MSEIFDIRAIYDEQDPGNDHDPNPSCLDQYDYDSWPDWFPMDKIDELEKLGAVGYTPEKVAIYFGVRQDVFMQAWLSENSPIRYHFERGILVNEAQEAIAMQTAANSGNTTQGQRLDKRRYEINFQNLKERICYGKE